MPARATWKALQAELVTALSLLEAGDRAGALAAVDAALAIDSEFLAAQALRERILSSPEPGVARLGRVRPEKPPVEKTTPAVESPVPVSTSLVTPAGYLKFEHRMKRRRVDREIEVAGAALDRGQIAEASAAVGEIAALDANSPELASLSLRLDRMRLAVPRLHRGPRLAAAVVGGCMLGGSYFYPGWQAVPPFVEAAYLQVKQIRSLVTRDGVASFLAVSSGGYFGSETRELVNTASDGRTSPQPTVPPNEMAAAGSRKDLPSAEREATRRPLSVVKPVGDSSGPKPNSTVREPVALTRFGGPPESLRPDSAVPSPTPDPLVDPVPVYPPATSAAAPAAPAEATVAAAPVPSSDGVASTAESYSSLAAAPPAATVSPAAEATSAQMRSSSVPLGTPAPRTEDDESLVKQVLQRYRLAYAGLDARSARAVWPQVDEAALAHAFDNLRSQQLTFDECNLVVKGPAASAICYGSTRYVPKVGSRDPHVEPRVWNFSLRKTGAEWSIERARTER